MNPITVTMDSNEKAHINRYNALELAVKADPRFEWNGAAELPLDIEFKIPEECNISTKKEVVGYCFPKGVEITSVEHIHPSGKYDVGPIESDVHCISYNCPKRWNVELKETADYITSVIIGHMFAQSLEANDCGEPWAICVLGSDADVEEEINRMLLNRRDAFNHLEKRKQYLNILRHFEAQLFSMRVPTLYFSRRWAERLLSHAYYLFNEGNMVEHRPKVAPAERKIAGLCMLVPGLGPVAAKTLIDKFGTIAALADACRDDELAEGLAVKFLAQLDGIGPIRAKRIADALTKGATK